MSTFLRFLHVLSAILIIGPLGLVPLYGLRGIGRTDTDTVEQAAKWTILFGAGSLITGLLGVAVLSYSDEYAFTTPWVIIATTLYVVLLAVVFFWTIPALRKGAKLLASPGHDADAKTRLDAVTGRVGAAAGVNLLLIISIIAMMTTQPFSS